MSVLNIEESVLIIIDIQEKLVNAAFNGQALKKRASVLAKAANILNIPTIITEQYPTGLGLTINEIKDTLNTNNSNYFEKIEFNAFSNVTLLNELKAKNRKQIILAGIETHICVRQTANELLKAGFDVSLAKDCCGSRSEDEHIAGLNIMKQEGCYIKTTEMILFELLKTAKHPNFKEIQAFIK